MSSVPAKAAAETKTPIGPTPGQPPQVRKIPTIKLPTRRPVTEEEAEWCSQFTGFSLVRVEDDGANVPEPFDADKNKVLTDAQRRNYRAVFVKARDLLLDDMADGPDDAAVDAMRKHSSHGEDEVAME